ncbi:LytR/AlgR family response regulator transcription factor [Aquimarina spongiae]|uniref:DNA-binding response regulator, LytR/AlgR family n=1 Tax=Aquimarina spongiae TaxID=570521 RepID=A0A1M6CXK1_9FLAO|nr:LytTR family DNA-binding domain-containing protein [Aquimarina spongiae]SHI65603.1 DNA-binding response regulator, LytR/AlgR family [Aquimarina spongiae]
MTNKVAILAREKSQCTSLLEDLKLSGVRRSTVFFSWKDIWLSEQKNQYDFILIDYYFFDMFRGDIVIYHLFHKYKYKITFYSNISQKVKTPEGHATIDLYRIFFRPFVDFNTLIKNTAKNEVLAGILENSLENESEAEKISPQKDTFFLKEGYSLIKFHLKEVLCLESDRNYITIYLANNGKHLIRETLQSISEILPKNFLRINRSVIINIDKVYKVVGNRVHIDGLNSFRPLIANKYKLDISNAVPLFSQKHTVNWNCEKKEKDYKFKN